MSSTYINDEYPIYTGKLEKWLEENLEEIIKLRDELAKRNAEIVERNAEIVERNAELAERNAEIVERNAEIVERNAELAERNAEIVERNSELADLKNQRNHQAVHIIQLAEKIGKQTEEISRLTYFLNQGSNTIANLKHRLSNLMTNQPPTYVCYPPPYNNML